MRERRAAVFAKRENGRLPVAGTIREILSSEDGQDIAEYAVLLALILVLIIGALGVMGEKVNGTFSRVADQQADSTVD